MAFRDGPFENIKVPLAWTAGVTVIVAGVGAALLLLGDASDGTASRGASGPVETAAAPAGSVLATPFRWMGRLGEGIGGYFFAVSENRRLKAELEQMRAWRDDAIALRDVNARYEALLGVQPAAPIQTVTAWTVSEARGPFSNTRLVNKGRGAGVRIGNPVVTEHGLVGRVVGAGPNISRVLMVTDVASRVPVMIERTDARGLLTGDGSGGPRLAFVRGPDSVRAGDRILTSGDGGGLPRGLPVGVAAKGLDGGWRVRLYADRGPVDLVRVLLFQDFSTLDPPEALNAPPLTDLAPVPMPAPPPGTAPTSAGAATAAAPSAGAPG